ncbi:hypothetical protein RHMOL_Rhmol07G0121300 [Rhododendron molle]|uniref:Uncharacterized protein n=1 Tax=Rhododendron molle TaxID=49168 RepID=A0ACC0N137_RHOML|nr:hypothetical protein RHMOL_Rhmol07G0121300 [Rhododendron molle]
MLRRLVTFFSDAPSWWRQHIDNDDPTRLLFTSCLLVSVLWLFTRILSLIISKNKYPPLPPGPRGLPLVGNLLSLEPELHAHFATLSRTYGSIFALRLGKKLTLVVTSAAVAREILKDNDVAFANRDVSVAGALSSYGGRDMVWSPYGPEWRMMRKVLVREMLSNTTLDTMYSLRRQEIRKTIGYLHSQVGTPVNIGELMFQTVLNVVTNMLWGGAATGGEEASVAVLFQPVIVEMIHLLGSRNISDLYPALAWLDLQGIGKKMKGCAKRLDVIFDGIIDQRLKMNKLSGTKGDGGKGQDFLQLLLHQKEEGDPKTPLTMIHVKALLMVCCTIRT